MSVFLPDANVLIYSFQEKSPFHQESRAWLGGTMESGDSILLTETTEIALLRISTHRKAYDTPVEEALGYWCDTLWKYGRTRRIGATSDHLPVFRKFVDDLQLAGDDLNDAWLAALAIEHRATLVSFDQGFARFPGLDWLDPSAS